MAELWRRQFTGTNGDAWELDTSGAWERVDGAAYDAVIQGNAGQAGATADERIYLPTSWPTSGAGHLFELELDWLNAAGAGRRHGIVLRCSDDGQDCYSFELDSNVGTPRVRIRRRNGGTWADVVSWTNASVNSAALNAGVTLGAKISLNSDGDVELSLEVDGTEEISATDSSGSKLATGGRAGVIIGPNCTTNDVTVDNLIGYDLEDDATATSTELDTGVALIIDGVYYAEAEWRAAGVMVGVGGQAYTDDRGWTLSDDLAWEDTTGLLYPGAVVTVKVDGDVAAFGKLRAADGPIDPTEGHTYTLHTPRTLANGVPIDDPDLGRDRIPFNFPEDSADHDIVLSDMSVGEIFEWVLENHAPALRRALAYPPTGDGWESAETGALTLKVPKLTVSGSVLSAIETLLGHTDYVVWIDPETLKWRLHDRDPSTTTDIDIEAAHATARVRVDASKARTAARIIGGEQKRTLTTLSTKDGSLVTGWPAAVEPGWNVETKTKDTDTGLVDTTGTSGDGYVTMDPDSVGPPAFSMVTDEWVGAIVRFEDGNEAGNTYRIRDHSGSQFEFESQSWQNGGPSNGDTFTVIGDLEDGGRSNGHKAVGRRYVPNDTNLRIPTDACGYATLEHGETKFSTKFVIENEPSDDARTGEQQGINLDLPSIGLINPLAGATLEDECTDDIEGDQADVTLTVPTIDITDKKHPSLRYPTSGYYGPAYSQDSGKWSGGGEPGRGDLGVTEEIVFNIPEFDGSAEQVTAYTAYLQAVVAILGQYPVEVQIEISGLDTSWLGLNQKVTLSSSSKPVPDWVNESLILLAVEFDIEAEKTILYAGAQSSGPYDVQGMRRRFQARNRLDEVAQRQEELQRILDCLKNGLNGGGHEGRSPVSMIPDCQVTTTKGGQTTTLRGARGDCTPADTECEPDCTDFPCGTVVDGGKLSSGTGLGAMGGDDPTLSLAGKLLGLDVEGDNLQKHVAHNRTAIALLACVLEGVASSHDQELHKVNTDLRNVWLGHDCDEINLQTLALEVQTMCQCINAFMRQVVATFALCAPGGGVALAADPGGDDECECPAVPLNCTVTTETVCEDPCPVTVPDLPDPPDC